MGATSRLALASLGMALVIGILGDWLIVHTYGLGLGAFLWVAALALAVVALARGLPRDGTVPDGTLPDGTMAGMPVRGGALRGEGRWLLAAAVVFAACLAWRASPILQFLDLIAIGLCLGLAALTLREGQVRRAGVLTYPLGLALSAVHHALGPFCLLFTDVEWKALSRGRGPRYAAAFLRGLILAVPLLLVFGSLLAAADAVFADLLQQTLVWNVEDWLSHVLGTLFFGFLAAGFLRTALIRPPDGLPAFSRPAGGGFALGAIEAGVVLGLLNLLFLAFVLVQVRYLFGGADLVMATAGLTYAEYARSGFFELLQATALVLPVLLALHWALPEGDGAAHRLYRGLGVPLVGLLFVVMASALQRLSLYVQEYGLTELRLYSAAFMLWLAFLFVWFLATVVRGARDRFAAGALAGGLAVLLLLHAVNPDALIARTNLARARESGRFDVDYAASLGADALPVLAAGLEQLPAADRQALSDRLRSRYEALPSGDWRSWNWGRSRVPQVLSNLSTD